MWRNLVAAMKDHPKNRQSVVETYQIGPFHIDAQQGTLRRDGEAVALTPKAFETLLLLVRNHGRVVSKEEVMQAIWPDTFVEEGILAQNILTVRKALQNPDWIETIPKRGYRFTGPVVEQGAERRLRWRWIGAAGAIALLVVLGLVIRLNYSARIKAGGARIRSLAVLPFHAISGEPPFLGLGLADVLINRLGTIGGVGVRPTSAVRRYADAQTDPVQAGRELGVDAVVEGNVQREGDRVRVTVEMLRIPSGDVIWAGKFDQQYGDAFTLEDSIAGQVANGMAVDLTAEQLARLKKRYTESGEAWQAYLRGRYFWNRRTADDHQKAIAEFEQATRIDPRYALAYAGLADAYALLGSNPNRVMRRSEAMTQARTAAGRAIEIDSELAEPHAAMAFILMHYDWKLPNAEREFERAIALNPSYATAHQWHAINLLLTGHPNDAIEELNRAQALDPTSLIIMADQAEMYIYTGRLADAAAVAEKTLNLDPGFGLARVWLGMALAEQNRFPEAEAVLKQGDPADPVQLAILSYVFARHGKREEAGRGKDQVVEYARGDFNVAYQAATICAAMGNVDGTLEWLERSAAERDGSLLLLRFYPPFAPVRQDTRMIAFLRREGLAER